MTYAGLVAYCVAWFVYLFVVHVVAAQWKIEQSWVLFCHWLPTLITLSVLWTFVLEFGSTLFWLNNWWHVLFVLAGVWILANLLVLTVTAFRPENRMRKLIVGAAQTSMSALAFAFVASLHPIA